MKLRYSRRATNDLASIYDYLDVRRPRGARNVMTAIYAAVEFIRRHPDAAQPTCIPGVRGRIVRKYRFKSFYRAIIELDVIEIVDIRHTSRRPWAGD
jgi:toxin ParE1/3/4